MNTYLFDVYFADRTSDYYYVTAPTLMVAHVLLQTLIENIWENVTGVIVVNKEEQ